MSVLCQEASSVSRGVSARPHLKEGHLETQLCHLPGSLRSCQPPSDDMDFQRPSFPSAWGAAGFPPPESPACWICQAV